MKYFLFDIGHVLVDFDFNDFLAAIVHSAGRESAPLTERDLEMHDAVEKGHITDQEWVDHLNAAKGLSWTRDDLIGVWADMFTINTVGRNLFKQALATPGLSVHTLSNIARHHMDAIENNWNGFFNGVDGLFLSYRIGVRKPHPGIYRHVLRELGVSGDQCLFIDDRPENVEAARQAGIDAHQFIPENHAAVHKAFGEFVGTS
jgi:putative hydrolase of the HAD superfamily